MLRDIYQSTITSALTPQTIKELNTSIAKFIDYNSEILLSLNLSKRYSFADADREVIYRAIHITEPQMIEEVKKASAISKKNKIQSNPFYIASILAIHFLLKKKDEKSAKNVMIYMSLMMYTSIHKGFFEYNNNKQIMDYTIAHLDNSYIIRHMNSLFAFLEDNATTTYNTYKNRLEKCDDKDITWVIDALWVRIKGKMKKIAQAFYKNHEEGNYLNASEDSYDENDYHEMDNNAFVADRLTNKVYIKLLNHQFDDRFIKYSITQSDTSYQKLKSIIDDIIVNDSENEVRKVISSLIEYYLQQSGKTPDYIARGDFVAFMKTAYSSNTELPQMVYAKTTIDKWLKRNMVKFGKANYGKTAMQQYRRSIYMFFVFIINYEAKV